jgi:hypothetical protein
LIYRLRLIIPSFLLYEKYRGPRSQKIIAIWLKLTTSFKNANHTFISSE